MMEKFTRALLLDVYCNFSSFDRSKRIYGIKENYTSKTIYCTEGQRNFLFIIHWSV